MSEIEPFFVMEIQRRALELAASGRDIIHMEIGQPDFGAPAPVLHRARQALQESTLGYTETAGLPTLRQTIACWYHHRFGVALSADRILLTTGASGAFMVLLGSLINPGDEVLLPDPGYPCNRHFVRMFEGKAHLVPTEAQHGFQPTVAQLKAHWGPRTRAVILASPANPTGTCIEPAELEAIHAWVREQGAALIVDEIYQGLVYERPPYTALTLGDDIFVVNSFSKYFGMTGWRLGWLVGPAECQRAFQRFAQNAYICPPALPQYAALEAFGTDSLAICEAQREEYQSRRAVVLQHLAAMGFTVPAKPDGAFYVYADCSAFGRSSSELARDMLERSGVAITPGRDFGLAAPERYVRLSYSQSSARLEEAMARLRHYLARG